VHGNGSGMADAARHIVHEIYSDVMFELAEETGQLDEVMTDLQAIGRALRAEPAFLSLLISPSLSEAEKAAMIRRVFAGRISPLTLDFLCVLARRNRMSFLNGISGRYEDRYDYTRNRRRVTVTLAKPPTDEETEKLKVQIREAIQAEVKLTVKVDPAILGGMVIQKGDMVIDNSVRNILDRTVKVIISQSKEKEREKRNQSS
jgi:F-type H+-transporting ATPase subunit delta